MVPVFKERQVGTRYTTFKNSHFSVLCVKLTLERRLRPVADIWICEERSGFVLAVALGPDFYPWSGHWSWVMFPKCLLWTWRGLIALSLKTCLSKFVTPGLPGACVKMAMSPNPPQSQICSQWVLDSATAALCPQSSLCYSWKGWMIVERSAIMWMLQC